MKEFALMHTLNKDQSTFNSSLEKKYPSELLQGQGYFLKKKKKIII